MNTKLFKDFTLKGLQQLLSPASTLPPGNPHFNPDPPPAFLLAAKIRGYHFPHDCG
jgi:hypothetical protein